MMDCRGPGITRCRRNSRRSGTFRRCPCCWCCAGQPRIPTLVRTLTGGAVTAGQWHRLWRCRCQVLQVAPPVKTPRRRYSRPVLVSCDLVKAQPLDVVFADVPRVSRPASGSAAMGAWKGFISRVLAVEWSMSSLAWAHLCRRC